MFIYSPIAIGGACLNLTLVAIKNHQSIEQLCGQDNIRFPRILSKFMNFWVAIMYK